MTAKVLCLGEALIDKVDRFGDVQEHVGGSLLNVACGIATLGIDSTIAAWWGKDDRGHLLAKWAGDSGVHVQPGTDGADRTSVANATLDQDGRATYTFDLEWKLPEIADLDTFDHLHTGSIGATLEPGGSQVLKVVKQARAGHATISYDPNIRPSLMGTPADALSRVEELVSLADVVKASDEDIAWLYPDTPVEDVMRRWAAMGPGMVVVTRGPWGAYAVLAGVRDMLVVDQMSVTVGDTVGAGDSFMAGLIAGLIDLGLLGSAAAREKLTKAHWSDVTPALHRGVVTSGLTVSKAGAYAPTMQEVIAVQDADPTLR